MCSHLLVLFVTIFLQVVGGEHQLSHHLFKRSPQQIDIQSIRQKQLTPEITVVDVVVNEPARRGYPNQNQYIQPVRQQPAYPGQGNYPNQYQNVPNRRQPEIQIIEVVDPRQIPGYNNQQPSRYPQGGQIYPIPNGGVYQIPNNQFPRENRPNRPNGNGRPRRPYRPNTDFFIQEVIEDDAPSPPPRRPHHHRRPGHRGHRPRPPRPNKNEEDESSEEEKYVFDGGDDTKSGEDTVAGYTKDNFPIIPLHKNDIRR